MTGSVGRIARATAIGIAVAFVVQLIGGFLAGMILGMLTAIQWIDVHPHQQQPLFNNVAFYLMFVSIGAGVATAWMYKRKSHDLGDGYS